MGYFLGATHPETFRHTHGYFEGAIIVGILAAVGYCFRLWPYRTDRRLKVPLRVNLCFLGLVAIAIAFAGGQAIHRDGGTYTEGMCECQVMAGYLTSRSEQHAPMPTVDEMLNAVSRLKSNDSMRSKIKRDWVFLQDDHKIYAYRPQLIMNSGRTVRINLYRTGEFDLVWD